MKNLFCVILIMAACIINITLNAQSYNKILILEDYQNDEMIRGMANYGDSCFVAANSCTDDDPPSLRRMYLLKIDTKGNHDWRI